MVSADNVIDTADFAAAIAVMSVAFVTAARSVVAVSEIGGIVVAIVAEAFVTETALVGFRGDARIQIDRDDIREREGLVSVARNSRT